MKKLTKSLIALVFLSSSLLAGINAMRVPGNVAGIGVKSKAWLSVNYSEVILYPQTTIKMNDKEANKLNEKNLAKRVKVKALSDGKNISILVKWKDDTKNIQEGYSTTRYADGFALQFPVEYKDPSKLPYIGMGSEGRAVVVHLKKATGLVYEPNGNGDVYHQVNKYNQNAFEDDLKKYEEDVKAKGSDNYQRVFISEGFRSMTQVKDGSVKGTIQMSYKDGYWVGTLSRPLKSEYLNLDSGAFPIAIAIWDGDKKNRDGLKLLSSWIGVKLVGKSGGDTLLKSLEDEPKADVKNGEKLAMENCSACHRYKDVAMAPEYMAPNLSNIGGYSTTEYLKESILNPSAVVVPGYNRNAHKNFAWYNVDDNGVRTSTMPPYDWMDKKSVDDIVAFLKSLKEEVE